MWVLVIAAFIASIITLIKGILGASFILALFVLLCNIVTLLNRQKLSQAGIFYTVVSLMILVYCGCYLFFGINVKALLKI